MHTTGGYMVAATLTTRTTFDLRKGDVFACVADCGWITGHTYIVYGPLSNGTTTVMFEGIPTYPDSYRLHSLCYSILITVIVTFNYTYMC